MTWEKEGYDGNDEGDYANMYGEKRWKANFEAEVFLCTTLEKWGTCPPTFSIANRIAVKFAKRLINLERQSHRMGMSFQCELQRAR